MCGVSGGGLQQCPQRGRMRSLHRRTHNAKFRGQGYHAVFVCSRPDGQLCRVHFVCDWDVFGRLRLGRVHVVCRKLYHSQSRGLAKITVPVQPRICWTCRSVRMQSMCVGNIQERNKCSVGMRRVCWGRKHSDYRCSYPKCLHVWHWALRLCKFGTAVYLVPTRHVQDCCRQRSGARGLPVVPCWSGYGRGF